MGRKRLAMKTQPVELQTIQFENGDILLAYHDFTYYILKPNGAVEQMIRFEMKERYDFGHPSVSDKTHKLKMAHYNEMGHKEFLTKFTY